MNVFDDISCDNTTVDQPQTCTKQKLTSAVHKGLPRGCTLLQALEWFESWLASTSMSPESRRVHLVRVKQFSRYIQNQGSSATMIELIELPALVNEFIKFKYANWNISNASVNNIIATFRLFSKAAGLPLAETRQLSDR